MKHYDWLFATVYGPDEDAAEAAKVAEAAKAAEAAKGSPKTFTQDEVNTFIAKEKREYTTKIEGHIKELEQTKRSKDLTDKARADLEKRITEMQDSLLTKEQLAQKEKERLENTHKEALGNITGERDTWKNRFTASSINVVITSEAAKAKAFDPDTLIAILGPHTQLVQDADTDGKLLETFTPKVKFNDTDKEGKPVVLNLTVPETVKRMMEIKKYGYLFESTAAAGLGGTQSDGRGEAVDTSKMSPAQYREHRKKVGLGRQP